MLDNKPTLDSEMTRKPIWERFSTGPDTETRLAGLQNGLQNLIDPIFGERLQLEQRRRISRRVAG